MLQVGDFVRNDGRAGHPFALRFAANLLLHSKGGATYRPADGRRRRTEAGFDSVRIEPTATPASLLYAR